MSGQTGFNYEVMISRLHGGLCAFQSLRAHRRQREQASAPAPATEPRATPEERATRPPPRPAPAAVIDDHASDTSEPQAFVTVGDRVVPLFGNLTSLFGVPSVPSTPSSTTTSPPPTASPVAADETRPPVATAPAPAAATLKLPPPMPPPRLGLMYGGHPPTPEPGAAPEPSPTPTRTPNPDPPRDASGAQELPSSASLVALLKARAQADAERLERANADHRAVMETLLHAHRDELRAQAEAHVARTAQLLREHRDELRAEREIDAARTAQLLREVLAQHRAELTHANQLHADRLAQQPNVGASLTPDDTGELRAALREQASLQREASEGVSDQISALATIVADLGHSVGMLAVAAAQKAHQSHLPTRPTFTPPPRTDSAAESARVDPSAAAPSPHGERVASAIPPQVDPTTARLAPTAPPSSNPTPPAANQPSTRPNPPPLRPRNEAAERARLQEALDDDSDDDMPAALASDDDDPLPRRRLAPLTALETPDDQEGDDDV